jgi:DNA-binding response OmpR family regulator
MGGSVLLIDDDVDVLRSIGNYFERLGYEVTRELSGEAGLATFDRLRPEVVILDLFLPGINGMEVLESLRQRDAVPGQRGSRRDQDHGSLSHGAASATV